MKDRLGIEFWINNIVYRYRSEAKYIFRSIINRLFYINLLERLLQHLESTAKHTVYHGEGRDQIVGAKSVLDGFSQFTISLHI